MPHIDIKCYPKHLTKQQLAQFGAELTALTIKYLNATESDVSINYTEIPAIDWKNIWDQEIVPNRKNLLKQPGYEM